MRLLIIGHARHGKTTVAEILNEDFGLTYSDSSYAAAKIFIYDALRPKYGYTSFEECYHDRVNHRAEWFDLICWYNREDKAALAKGILKDNDMYCGMRSSDEIKECLRQELFDFVIGVYDPRKPLEPEDSFNIDLWDDSDFIIPNGGSLENLRERVRKVMVNHVLLETIDRLNFPSGDRHTVREGGYFPGPTEL